LWCDNCGTNDHGVSDDDYVDDSGDYLIISRIMVIVSRLAHNKYGGVADDNANDSFVFIIMAVVTIIIIFVMIMIMMVNLVMVVIMIGMVMSLIMMVMFVT
jgi:hypothetical protein